MVSVEKECRQILLHIMFKKIIHKRCSGVRGDLSGLADGFMCMRCGRTIQEADLAEDLSLEVID